MSEALKICMINVRLLQMTMRKESMVAANLERVAAGKALAYGERAFFDLATELLDTVTEILERK